MLKKHYIDLTHMARIVMLKLYLSGGICVQISSTQLPCQDKAGEGGSGEDCSDIGPCLMCVARRIPQNEKHLQLGAPIEQFTIKLEPSGKIIAVDASGLSTTYSQFINKVTYPFHFSNYCYYSIFSLRTLIST